MTYTTVRRVIRDYLSDPNSASNWFKFNEILLPDSKIVSESWKEFTRDAKLPFDFSDIKDM